MAALDYEKLGAFYLGRPYDLAAQKQKDGLLLYDSKDLVTHGVCLGMTGSGKTGLCVVLLEEAAIDGIPAIMVDPKGDIPNLLLHFPKLQPSDFEPWVLESEALQLGKTRAEFAAAQAELWRKGLLSWDQPPERIARLHEAVEFRIYTPGSEAGFPVSVMKSFDAPPPELREDRELFRERVSSTATALLSLIGISASPLQSREHILLASILDQAWGEGKNLDLAALIHQVQSPPFSRVGVLDLESFYPSKDRFSLAMALNGLLAAPGFEAWLQGEALDIDRILYTPSGKPRHAIFSIAHLNDAERMFFVSMLFNQVLAWMRRQAGTTSLRALLYMDEIAGYLPPVANPPSKQPLLTLMKQARAFGLGVVLATQNPVDLDYKALSNAGTWWLGRLQTERDQARVLDGLAGVAATSGAAFDRQKMEQTLAALGKRIFLQYNVHDTAPEVFQTRWALSYLCGPLTRHQIKMLMDPLKAASPAPQATLSAAHRAAAVTAKPVLPPDLPVTYLPVRTAAPPGATLYYQPCLLGVAQIRYTDAKLRLDEGRNECRLVEFGEGAVQVDWDQSAEIALELSDLTPEGAPGASYAPLPPRASQPKSYAAWSRDFATWLAASAALKLYRSPSLGEISRPGESEREFRIRLDLAARQERDRRVAALQQKFAPQFARLQERIRAAELRQQREAEQARRQKLDVAFSIGGTLLGALFGRKAVSSTTLSKAGAAVRSASKASKEAADVRAAEETLEALKQQLDELNARFQEESAALAASISPLTETLETIAVKPKKTNITVRLCALAWAPYWRSESGLLTPAFG